MMVPSETVRYQKSGAYLRYTRSLCTEERDKNAFENSKNSQKNARLLHPFAIPEGSDGNVEGITI
jgi:hypothetical protein